MSMLFNHWHEDEYAEITKGDLNRLEYENEKLREKAEKYDRMKEAINDIKAHMKRYCDKNCPYSEKQREFMCRACMMGDAIDMVDNYTEGLL